MCHVIVDIFLLPMFSTNTIRRLHTEGISLGQGWSAQISTVQRYTQPADSKKSMLRSIGKPANPAISAVPE